MPRITVRTFRPQDAEQASRILIAAFKTFLNNFHMQKTKETAAETETKRL